MAGSGAPLRLRDWLVAQIESGRYEGLRWEDADKTIFRIPWKHAAKLGYEVQQDAALFRAWAVYKGKHLEGTDKEEPSTWKTRLRCALNKSADFCEVRERNQLDISNPYKVYRIVAKGTCGPGYQAPSEDLSNPDCWLHVRLYYGAVLVTEATARTAEGCCLSPRAAATEHLLGPLQRIAQVCFPPPPPGARALQHLLPHLERGVLLWVAPEGVFAKRLCQGRVYWRGPLAPHRARPNKLERERTCQLLDTRRFLAELCAHLRDGHPEPEYQIRLCFGEEYPGPPGQPEERLVMAHVEPVFAQKLLLHLKRFGLGDPVDPQSSMPSFIHLLTHLSQP
ncbi:interferon regulatory factor 4-like [Orycteropus afer afer]|uniref:Interferon regulatory factor 4-like n=1 Tax=Orycteropus afer afer TaxID=1230840 RepID=A0A8B6ZB98_ORYAF|nr:interferon regulatory factor 4-like [Orycteropus afer afer]